MPEGQIVGFYPDGQDWKVRVEWPGAKKPKNRPLRDIWNDDLRAQIEERINALPPTSQPIATDPIDIEFEMRDGNPVQLSLPGIAPVKSLYESQPYRYRGERFHHAYNFIPPAPTPAPETAFSEGDAATLDRARPGTVSGYVDVTLTTVTPLLAIDGIRTEWGANEHQRVVTRTVADKAFLDPAGLKGALRSLFEAATGSRMGVLNAHDRPAGFRLPAGERQVVPVELDHVVGHWVAKLMVGTEADDRVRMLPNNHGHDIPQLHAAWVPRHLIRAHNLVHGDQVQAVVRRIHKDEGRKKYECWQALDVARLGDPPPPWPAGAVHCVLITGRLHITGPDTFGGKHDERLFFTAAQSANPTALPNHSVLAARTPVTADVPERVLDRYRQLLDDYGKQLATNPGPYKAAEFARQAKCRFDKSTGRFRPINAANGVGWAHIQPGLTAYAELDASDPTAPRVLQLLPVEQSRRMSEYPIADFIPPGLRPPDGRNRLTMADRVFGWVRPQDSQGPALRGRVRIEPAGDRPSLHRPGEAGEVLAVLGQPKPTQARFYLGERSPTGVSALPQDREKTDVFYTDPTTQVIRGFKVFPTHREGLSTHVYRRAHTTTDSQNRTVRDWVPSDSALRFRVWFEALSPVEAGALLWLLDLTHQNPESKARTWHLRLGGGKPLGFGTVEAAVTDSRLHSNDAAAQRVASWPPDPAEESRIKPTDLIQSFSAEAETAWGAPLLDLRHIRSIVYAASGFDDGVPVSYTPSTNGNRGEHFSWHRDNERKQGPKATLPDLADKSGRIEAGLPRRPNG